MNWLKDVNYKWAELGRSLGVSQAYINSLPRYEHTATNNLADILDKWRKSRTSDYTIEKLLDVLNLMNEDDVSRNIQRELLKAEVADYYSKQADYEP